MDNGPGFTALAESCREQPPLAVFVLGSGMGPVARRLRVLQSVAFAAIPGLPAVSVHGHKGCLTLGEWAGRRVLVYEGRLHFYEGHSWDTVTLPVRTAATLGARVALLTNAAGGIGDALSPGSLMAITDHLECNRPSWWRQPGPPRPSPYSARLLECLLRAAPQAGVVLHWGVYAAVTGPCYETPAEIRALKAWGADAVGMSTAREIQAGHDVGMECAAVSCITNRAAGLSGQPLNHEEVLAMAATQAEQIAELLERFLLSLDRRGA
jgi:purine-nucleoside phosphorylase